MNPSPPPLDPPTAPPRTSAPAPRLRCAVAVLAFALAPAVAGAAPAPAAPPPLVKMVSHVGMSRLPFSRVNENDAAAAYRFLNAELAKDVGYDLTSDMRLYDSPVDFAQAIRAGEVNFIIVGTWEFLTMAVEDAVTIEFAAVDGQGPTHRWLLLVRRDAGINTLRDLKGKAVTVLQNNMAALGIPWIETELLEQSLGTPATFFASLVPATKPTAVILPVFFGKVPACVVDETAFNAVAEMNPQVGHKLVPIARSEPLLNGVICFNHLGWTIANGPADMSRALASLHLKPAGRQLLTIFKCDRLLPFDPAQLASVKRLYARHRQLQDTPKS